ncbi:hypothetical protein [Candidatus Electronema sp. PJ]|uniref:hypothetical protein n=1 Tax=Candidatus Electronema sp. PJ TaxID=3401572 RepID=UPI003AA8A96E
MAIQWRPELNALTNPPSYRARVIPKDSFGYKRLAERIVQKNPVCSVEQAEAVLRLRDEEIKEILLEGSQVSLENSFTYHLSITGRMDAPDDPLPPDSTVNVQVYAVRPYVETMRPVVKLERLPPEQKVPFIAGAEDTVLDLKDVLNPAGALRLTGTDMLFDPKTGSGECVIEGTRAGRAVQSRFAMISNSMMLVVPEIPIQPDHWNNEYRVSVSTRYTAHGTLRTGAYQRLLRTPLAVNLIAGSGILSGAETSPLVGVTGGQFKGAATSARVRIQAALNAQDGKLRLSLLDMSEGGAAGDGVQVTENGVYTLLGYADSALASLEVMVENYTALINKVRDEYTSRMVDILDVSSGT